MRPISQRTFALLKGKPATFWARKFQLQRSTILAYLSQRQVPDLFADAVENVTDGRKPIDEGTIVFDYGKLGVSFATVLKSPIVARHAYAYRKQHRKRMTKEDAAALFLVARSKLKPWTDRTYHDPNTGDTLRGATFDRLEQNGWVRLSPRFRCVIFTRKGRDDLDKWNLTHT